MRIEPRELIRGGPPQSGANDLLVGVDHRKLGEHLFRFAAGIRCRKERTSAEKWVTDHGNNSMIAS